VAKFLKKLPVVCDILKLPEDGAFAPKLSPLSLIVDKFPLDPLASPTDL